MSRYKMHRAYRLKNTIRKLFVITVIAALMLLVGRTANIFPDSINSKIDSIVGRISMCKPTELSMQKFPALVETPSISQANTEINAETTIMCLDVGQADSTLILSGEHAMIIDGGNNEDGELIVKYLKSLGINALDYVIVTHADEDHSGGIDDIIKSFSVDKIILPYCSNDKYTYNCVLEAANNSSGSVIFPCVGDIFPLGDASWVVYSCDSDCHDNINASSIVVKFSYGKFDMMLMGDALISNEQNIISSGYDTACEVLKAGHHGSASSNSSEWLKAVSPEDIIISVGLDNEYGLPNDGVMRRFNATGANIWRTDRDGTIVIVTDGIAYDISVCQTDTDGKPPVYD